MGPIQLAIEPDFTLGPLSVAPAARTIRYRDGPVLLEPRAMQVLVALATPVGQVVGRATLVERCWEGRIVGDDAINRAILKLRRGLQEVGAPATVETVAKVGYRLDVASLLPPDALDLPRRHRLSRRRLLVLGGGALAAGAATIVVWPRRQPSPPPAAAPSRARELFERGQVAFQQGSRDDNAQAVAFFEEAARLAPDDPAIAGALALACRFEQTFRGPAMLEQSTRRANLATERALRLDPRNSDAIAARSMHLPFGSQWLTVERGLRAGLREVPASGVMNGFLGMVLFDVGRVREAITAFELSQRNARFVPLLRVHFIQALLSAGRHREADRELDAAIALWPRFAGLWWLRFWSLALSGRLAQAHLHATSSPGLPLGIGPGQLAAADRIVVALAEGTGAARATAIAAWDRAVAVDGSLRPMGASVCAALGDVDEALQRAYRLLAPLARGGGISSPGILFDATWAGLWGDPRFLGLCAAIGLRRYWQQSGSRPDFLPFHPASAKMLHY